MEDCSELNVGMKVRYQPSYFEEGRFDNGVVKRIDGNLVWVVYHCDDNWKEYYNYTASLTRIEDLVLGWK